MFIASDERDELLFGCLRADAATVERLALFTEDKWHALLESAARNLVGPALWHRLLSPPFRDVVPPQIRSTLAARRQHATVTTMALHQRFRDVVSALHDQGIPVIALKGMHLATLVYGDPGRRPMKDIDVLVPIQEAAKAAGVMRDLGYAPVEALRIQPGPVPNFCQHLPRFVKPGAPPVEIHWHLIHDEATIAFDIQQIWDRAVPARIAGVDVHVLSPEDLLLHLCVHAAHDHLSEWTARPWCDLAAVIDHFGAALSWDLVVSRATAWHCRRCTYLALRFAADLVGAAVPVDVLESLKPNGFDDRILRLAMNQRHGVRLSPQLAKFSTQSSVRARLCALWNAVVLPKALLARVCNVPASSRLGFALYGVRAWRLLTTRWSAVRRLRRDKTLNAIAVDIAALQAFVAEE